jgi:hypothetical protein
LKETGSVTTTQDIIALIERKITLIDNNFPFIFQHLPTGTTRY